MESHPNPWKTLSEKTIYDNRWISLSHREVINPNGGNGIYGLVHFKNTAIGIIPIDEEDHTWLVGQYRYALGRYSWEIPEGGCPLGQDPLEGARRELLEETGITARHWRKLLDMDLSNSVTDETGSVYLATGLTFGAAAPEETEDLQLRRVPFREALDMVLDGRITDSLSVAGILRLAWEMMQKEKGEGA